MTGPKPGPTLLMAVMLPLMASSGVEAAVTLLDGGTLENNLIIADSVWIDSSNVADYE